MRTLTFVLIMLLAGNVCFAQQRSGTSKNSAAGLPLSERIFFGGGGTFGGGIHPSNGYRYRYISISPLVGYRITMPFAAGVSLLYQRYSFPDVKINLDQYGASPFVQYRFGKLFAYAEYQVLSVPNFDRPGRSMYTRLPIGLGFSQPIGARAAINAVALYDVTYNRATSPFTTPWIVRVYITAGGISF
jgi:hypothetical protein